MPRLFTEADEVNKDLAGSSCPSLPSVENPEFAWLSRSWSTGFGAEFALDTLGRFGLG
jgi:hypothetical protein